MMGLVFAAITFLPAIGLYLLCWSIDWILEGKDNDDEKEGL